MSENIFFTLVPKKKKPQGILPSIVNTVKGGQSAVGSTTEYEAKSVSPRGIIDVINQCTITPTPLTRYLQNKIPYAFLVEYDLNFNSYISQLALYAKIAENAIVGVGVGIGNVGNVVYTKVGEFLKGTGSDKIISNVVSSKIFQEGEKLLEKPVGSVGSFTSDVARFTKDSLNILNGGEFSKNSALAPYNNLYIRQKTGFTYILPYFNNNYRSISTSFNTEGSDDSLAGKSGLVDFLKGGRELIDKGLGLFMSGAPGAFIEQPKFYSYGTESEPYTIEFELINTINPEDYIKHFYFIYLLLFQNLPYRTDLTTIRPPKIYRCVIPGDQDIPFCYIRSVNVTHVGNRRILRVPSMGLPNAVGSTFDANIPDIYKVTLDIVSLTPFTGNFMVNLNQISVR